MLQRLRHAVGWGLTPPPQGTRVDFQVCAPLGHGQTLFIVGDIPALGGSLDCVPSIAPTASSSSAGGSASSSETGLALVTTPELYPIWYNPEPILVPSGSVLRYRYAVCTGAKFARYESVTREIVVGLEDIQRQDTLDAHDAPSGDVWGIVPRLSSGQAFVDRRASGGSGDSSELAGEGAGAWSARRSSAKRHATASISESIPEESADVVMRDAAEDSESAALAPPVAGTTLHDLAHQAHDDEGRTHGGRAVPMHGALLAPRHHQPHAPLHVEVDSLPPPPRSFVQRNQSAPAAPSTPLGVGDEDTRLLCSSPVLNRARSYSDESAKSPQNVTIESTDGVIIVVYRLPVLVQRAADGTYHIEWEDDNLVCPSGLLKESHGHGATHWDRVNSMRLTWVGTVHCSSVIPREDEERLARQLEEFHCVPVFLQSSLAETFHGFCYGTLWPIFHNLVDVYGRLPTRWWNPNQQRNAWASYKNVNRIFVNKVIEVYNDGDLVWVHDLHLLVAPSFLSRRLPNVNVGLFLHTPFPSSEIFRTLSVRADLLRGMLSADHIGFHLYEHARHFLTSCRRILGLKYSAQPGGYIGIEYSGRMVMLTISHIGIEPAFMDVVRHNPSVVSETEAMRAKYRADERTIIVSVDKVERLKGILLKFGALEHFVLQYPAFLDKLQVVQVGLVDSSNPSEEKTALHDEIWTTVKRINDRFACASRDGEPLICYFEVENTDLAQRLPLWTVGDILLTTSVRDAVNLYPFEFVYANELAQTTGVVIVSEFSGSSRVLTGSIGVNPWKRDEIVKALHLAMTMSEDEKRARHRKDLEYITNNSRTKWAERILVDLKRTKKYAADGEYMGYGLGLGFRMLEFNAGFKLLDSEAVAKAYRSSFRRVLLFDYGGTLTQDANAQRFGMGYGAGGSNSALGGTSGPGSSGGSGTSSGKKNDFAKYLHGIGADSSDSGLVSQRHDEVPMPSPEVLSALSLLCADPRNTVFVLSGRERGDMEKALGNVKGLGLAAEHGYLYKWGDARAARGFGSSSSVDKASDDVWLCTKDNFDDSWKDITHSVMDIYTQRTHGTYVELKGSSMLWQFRDADPEFGQLQAKELHDQLTQVLEHFQVEVLTGNDYLEVRPEGVDKGVVVDRILSTLESTGQPGGGAAGLVDFVLCVGDDESDEFMFQYLEESRRNLGRTKHFTVTVGKKPSAAKYFVNDVDQVMEVLHSLTKVSTAANRNLSLNDLRLLDPHHHSRLPPSDIFSHLRVHPPPMQSTGFHSDVSFEGATRGGHSFGSSLTPTAAMVRGFDESASNTNSGSSSSGNGSGGLGLRSKYSMSMSALSSVASTFPTTSSTYEQYFSNIDESGDDQGGIFF
ncbi:hypothetical protein P43SY_003612 [Pythium insidiosum]|uniref:CBM20 domain-containing protein n=1 Tax=Pythium insidiosum TaxID=114742 RepID=A0AAD5QB80_PYTIN|nr:hypothetical protein P43SY_003612 [Pythium insidiosum]